SASSAAPASTTSRAPCAVVHSRTCSGTRAAVGASAGAATTHRPDAGVPEADTSFTAAQAARLTGCTPARLEAWRRIGLVGPATNDGYGFRDLVALRMVASLLEDGVAMGRIRRAVTELLAAGEDISSLSLVSEGDTVLACRDDGQVLDALRRG